MTDAGREALALFGSRVPASLQTLLKETGEERYQNALKYHTQALETRVLESDKVLSLNNIGTVYCDMGDYQNALKYFTQASNIMKKIAGEELPDYAKLMQNIGSVYSNMGDYQNALKYHTQALEIRKSIFGTSHPKYAESLHNLSSYYSAIGQYTICP